MSWSFLTNHSHVLVCLTQDPEMRIRDIADVVGITERAVQRILTELEEEQVITREKEGRRNTYSVDMNHCLHHKLEEHCTLSDLLNLINHKQKEMSS